MIIYRVYTQKTDGAWFKEFEVPDDFEFTPGSYTSVPLPKDMRFPRFDWGLNAWVEDKDDIIMSLKEENNKLSSDLETAVSRVNVTESALLDLADMILSR